MAGGYLVAVHNHGSTVHIKQILVCGDGVNAILRHLEQTLVYGNPRLFVMRTLHPFGVECADHFGRAPLGLGHGNAVEIHTVSYA